MTLRLINLQVKCILITLRYKTDILLNSLKLIKTNLYSALFCRYLA